jgi:integrase
MWRLIQNAGEKLGIPKDRLHPHAFRHLFGLKLSQNDISTNTRMHLLSHNSPVASEIYDHLNSNMARAAMEKANPFTGMITPGAALLEAVKKEGKIKK